MTKIPRLQYVKFRLNFQVYIQSNVSAFRLIVKLSSHKKLDEVLVVVMSNLFLYC